MHSHLRYIGAAACLCLVVTAPVRAFAQKPAAGTTSAVAQTASSKKADPLVIGETFTIQSKVLGERRRINVYVPPIYRDSAIIRLPVMYMPDGGMAEDFLHVAGLVQVSTGNATM